MIWNPFEWGANPQVGLKINRIEYYEAEVTRRYEASRFEVITSLPPELFEDIDSWCEVYGLGRPCQGEACREFKAINLAAGDSINFTLKIPMNKKHITLFKLTFGGRI